MVYEKGNVEKEQLLEEKTRRDFYMVLCHNKSKMVNIIRIYD